MHRVVYILDIAADKFIEAEIFPAGRTDMPLKKEGWSFNWKELIMEPDTQTYILRIKEAPNDLEGILHLKIENGMLIMDVIEIAPHNIGRTRKRYDFVAGCLIAFACRESYRIERDYKGFLTFVSKTKLIDWYIEKYGAEVAFGQRMYIDFDRGLSLIEKYLNRTLK